MEKIYSKDGTTLLHIINRLSEVEGRTNIIEDKHLFNVQL